MSYNRRNGIVVCLLMFCTLLGAASFADAQSPATVVTNRDDYSPGDTAIISGFGFSANEAVQLDIGCTGAAPPTTLYTNANSSGNFTGVLYAITSEHAGQECTVTATGLSSGRTDQTTFTDTSLGLGRVSSVVPVDGGCVHQDSIPVNSVESWDVQQGKTYDVTLTNLTDCANGGTDPTIQILVKSSSTGNMCLTATRLSTGTYRFQVTMPSNACHTYPIQYCTENCSASTDGSFLARRSDGGNKASHLRASTFGANCSDPQEDNDCGAGCTVSIDCPPDIVVCTDAGQCSAVVDFSVTATGNCPPISVVCNPASGSTFPHGLTDVVCTAMDDQHNTDTCTFRVTVNDCEPPTITCPPDLTAECTSPSGATVTYTVTATDNCDPDPTITCTIPSGSTFPIGTTQVCCTATDDSGNHSDCCFNVVVTDGTPPTIVCPPDITTECTGPNGATVTYTVTASDTCDPDPTITCTIPSGSTFPIGTTQVCCTATDDSGNPAECCFNVVVTDGTPPTITCPPSITAECTDADGATVTYTVTASDTCDPNPTITCTHASGSHFPDGTTQVCCTATDDAGNSSECCFDVTVVDTTPPTITCPPDITVNVRDVNTPVTFEPTVSDVCDPNPLESCDPPSGSNFPPGCTVVVCTATDDSNNTAFCSFEVCVNVCVGFDLTAGGPVPPDTFITNQYEPLGLLVDGLSDTGRPGVLARLTGLPGSTTEDILPVSTPNYLQTDGGDGSSDSGVITFTFVDPDTGDPRTAAHVSLNFLDIELSGSGPGGAARTRLEAYDPNGALLQSVFVPIGPNGGQFLAQIGSAATPLPIAMVVAVVGTPPPSGESGGIDELCFTFNPPDISLQIGCPLTRVAIGENFTERVFMKNNSGRRLEVTYLVRGWLRPQRTRTVTGPNDISVGPTFDRYDNPFLYPLRAPNNTRLVGRVGTFEASVIEQVTLRPLALDRCTIEFRGPR